MRTPFFITGLPRSRTAWLANLFTTDMTVCHHDVPFSNDLIARNPKRVGFSGSELVIQRKEIKTGAPMANWLVIERDPDEAFKSFLTFCRENNVSIGDGDIADWFSKRVALLNDINDDFVIRVDYRDLDTECIVEMIWNHLVPEKRFDSERWQILNELRVEQHWEKAVESRKELIAWR